MNRILKIFVTKTSVVDPDQFSGSGSVGYSNGTTKLTGRENLTKNTGGTFCVGPVVPTNKENLIKMYKKYRSRYITSLKR
jgi:hypothetical protein